MVPGATKTYPCPRRSLFCAAAAKGSKTAKRITKISFDFAAIFFIQPFFHGLKFGDGAFGPDQPVLFRALLIVGAKPVRLFGNEESLISAQRRGVVSDLPVIVAPRPPVEGFAVPATLP